MKLLISIYQFLKPLRTAFYTTLGIIPHSCRHQPSCSQYAKQALEEYGTIQGSVKAVARILSCHPFSSKT